MILFLFLFLSTITWCLIVRFALHKTITWGETAAQIGIGIVVSLFGLMLTASFPAYDIEVFNGKVTEKYSEKVSCSHSYQCNPRKVCTTVNKKKECHTEYDTCYEHPWDRSWRVQSTLGRFTVDREDRRGLEEPKRWSEVKVEDPVSETRNYRSYVRDVPENFMSHVTGETIMKEYEGRIPKYPSDIFDMYKINRVIEAGQAVPNLDDWNKRTSEFLKDRGSEKKVNLVTVFTNEESQRFSQAIEAAWMGGKKNDVIVIMGTPQWPKISWVRVLSWTESEFFKVYTRNSVLAMENVNIDKYFEIMKETIDEHYVYSSMRRFEYMTENRTPPTWAIVTAVLLTIIANIVTTYIFHKNNF